MLLLSVGLAILSADAVPPRVVVTSDEAPRHRIAQGLGVVRLLHNASTGSSEVALSVLELQPGAAVPEHTHDAGEWLYVLSGTAQMVVDGKASAVKPGDAVFIPRGVKHQSSIAADAKVAFRAVQVYSPAGPEQRFTQGPKVNPAPRPR